LYAEAHLPLGRAAYPLAETLYASGERIDDGIGYAVSQRNNHAISGAAGLIALGVRFMESGAVPTGWLARGHALLERLILEQFAPDGWYIQHSFTYLRLALDQCVVAERCLRAVGLRLSTPAVERLTAAAGLLEMLLEAESGIVPNHGPNDGAFVHPITSGSYRDFRPVVTAVSALWDRPLPADLAPDRETLAWLGLESPPSGPARDDGLVVGDSGWAFVRSGEVELFLRAGSYESRPGHVDPLHIDVRIGGQEVVVDPGTFAYSAPAPWHNGLAGHDVHNGP
jgi:asparagine synthase (glutamine-hydrolysing)